MLNWDYCYLMENSSGAVIVLTRSYERNILMSSILLYDFCLFSSNQQIVEQTSDRSLHNLFSYQLSILVRILEIQFHSSKNISTSFGDFFV